MIISKKRMSQKLFAWDVSSLGARLPESEAHGCASGTGNPLTEALKAVSVHILTCEASTRWFRQMREYSTFSAVVRQHTIDQDKNISRVDTSRRGGGPALNKALDIHQKTTSARVDALAEFDTDLSNAQSAMWFNMCNGVKVRGKSTVQVTRTRHGQHR